MKESFFKFSDPYISSFQYKDNDDFDPEKFEEMKINFKNKIMKDEDKQRALVEVTMKIGDEVNCPFSITIVMQSYFYWGDCDNKELIKNLLEKNAVSLLIGYIRPIVANITSFSRFPTYNLPFVNLADDEKE